MQRAPLKALAANAAQQHCAGVAEDHAREMVEDVMVTGEAGFAQLYLMGEQVGRNTTPDPPVLGFPEDWRTDLTGPVDFT